MMPNGWPRGMLGSDSVDCVHKGSVVICSKFNLINNNNNNKLNQFSLKENSVLVQLLLKLSVCLSVCSENATGTLSSMYVLIN